jgi:hypothetical protein
VYLRSNGELKHDEDEAQGQTFRFTGLDGCSKQISPRKAAAAGKRMVQSIFQADDAPPACWTMRSFKHKPRRIDITSKVIDGLSNRTTWQELMQGSFNRTINKSTLGSGRDQVHKMRYSDLRVASVSRIESPELWKQYVTHRDLMASQLRQQQVGHVDSQTEFLQPPTHPDCNRGLNEMFLYHGFKAEYLDTITTYGLDEHVGSLDGMFGAGIYFADMISKSDQYVVPNSDGRYSVFVARVCLGAAHKATGTMCGERRAPVMADMPGRPFDSVVYDQSCGNFTGGGFHYNEFIVYNKAQAYPEFLVEFERV